MQSHVEQAVLDTVSYFSIFNYPLTLWELHTYLHTPVTISYQEMLETISFSAKLRERIDQKDGFIFLRGNGNDIVIRQNRYIENHLKYKIVKRFITFAKHIPGIEMIAVCNNLAFFNGKEESDLDLFIVTKKNVTAFVRFITVVVTMLFFKRPSSTRHKNTVCLSFFVDEDHVNITAFRFADTDIYMTYWYATLQPVFIDSKHTYRRIEQENKSILAGCANYLPRYSTQLTVEGISKLKALLSFFPAEMFSKYFYNMQIKKLPRRIKEHMNTSTAVIVTPTIFKLHVDDARQEIYDRWKSLTT